MGGSQRFCTRCGHELKAGSRFCTGCGHAVPLAGQPTGRRADDTGQARAPRHGPRWPPIVGLMVLVAAGAVTALLLLHPFGGGTASAGPAASKHPVGRPSAASATSAQPAQTPSGQQAASRLAALLAASVADRNSVVAAVSDVNQCGPRLSQDVQIFRSAAASRQHLLSELASLPGNSALPAQMVQVLTTAWQASAQADRDYAQWAQDELSQGCIQNDHSDAAYQASAGPDSQATADKKAFARLWNPVAAQYGLPQYRWDQL